MFLVAVADLRDSRRICSSRGFCVNPGGGAGHLPPCRRPCRGATSGRRDCRGSADTRLSSQFSLSEGRLSSKSGQVGPRADSAQTEKAPTNLRSLMCKGNYVTTGGRQRPEACSSQPTGQTLHAGGRQQSEACNVDPTDSKEREKARQKQQKAEGRKHIVTKPKPIVEDHYDDCGDDLSSLNDTTLAALVKFPCEFDTENELSDADRNECLFTQLTLHAFHNHQKVESLYQAKIAGHLHSGSHRVQDARTPELVKIGSTTGRLENMLTPTTIL
jgi:hypothetical protein